MLYEELVKALRNCSDCYCGDCKYRELLEPGNWVKCQNKLIDEAADAIEELQKAENFHKFNSEFWEDKYNSLADEKWISVTERLPEKEDEAVIVWEKQGFALIDWRHDNKWAILDNNCGIATHWMPIPPPPMDGE